MHTHAPNPPHTRAALTILTILALLTTLATACADDAIEPTPLVHPAAFTLAAAPDCNALHESIIDAYTERVLRQLFKSTPPGNWPLYSEDPNDPSNIYPGDHTDPAFQNASDNEPDVLKTDGKFIYTITDNQLLILRSAPLDQTAIVGRHALAASETPRALLLKDHRAVLFSTLPGSDVDPYGKIYGKNRVFAGTRITLFDVSDPTTPIVEHQFDIEGFYKTARLLDNKIYLTTRSNLPEPIHVGQWISDNISSLPDTGWTSDTKRLEQRKNQARTVVRERLAQDLADLDIQTVLPRLRTPNTEDSADNSTRDTAPLYDTCTDFYLPHQITNFGLRNISSIDLDQPTRIQSTGLFSDGWTLYATHQNLYFSISSRSWSLADTHTPYETHIHKFELQPGKSKPAYTASGKVDGWLLNRFAMSEYDGHLRVTTANNHLGWATSNGVPTTHITILQQTDNLLTTTGSLHELASGKPIHAAPKIGNHGYLVSFNPEDPLYTFDLTDLTQTRPLGELEIPGQLHAIHALDDHNQLIISSSHTGRSLHLQIFDVSDPQNPTRTHHYETPDTQQFLELSLHAAFTYDAARARLAIPVDTYDEDTRGPFSGLLLLSVNPRHGFQETGRINHTDLIPHPDCNEHPCTPTPDKNWRTYMRRSLFTTLNGHDYIYSLSAFGLKINDLAPPHTEHAAVLFRN